MGFTVHNKLVRDKIIEKIWRSWWTATFHTADDQEFEQKLKEKLVEESTELNKAKSVDEIKKELADVLKVAQEIKKLYNISEEEISQLIKEKDEESGEFNDRTILDETA